MIDKELLKEHFPEFSIHGANFKNSKFFLMFSSGLSLHIDITWSGIADISVYKYSSLLFRRECKENVLIGVIKQIYGEYIQY